MADDAQYDLSTLDVCERAVLRRWRAGERTVKAIVRSSGYAYATVVRALSQLRACGLIREIPAKEYEEPEPSEEVQADIEGRIESIRRLKVACRRQYGEGVPPDVLDEILSPVDCYKTRRRKRS